MALLGGGFLWGFTLFLGARIANTREFDNFVNRRGAWLVDATAAMIGDDGIAYDTVSMGLRVAGARWQRWSGLPVPEARVMRLALRKARRAGGRGPDVALSSFLTAAAEHKPADVARSLGRPRLWLTVHLRRDGSNVDAVRSVWSRTGPRQWTFPVDEIREGETLRRVLFEIGLLARVTAATTAVLAGIQWLVE